MLDGIYKTNRWVTAGITNVVTPSIMMYCLSTVRIADSGLGVVVFESRQLSANQQRPLSSPVEKSGSLSNDRLRD